MKLEQMVLEIHETVTDIRLQQARQDERVKDIRKDVDGHDEDIENLKAANWKFKGAGVLIGLLAVLSRFWENIIK